MVRMIIFSFALFLTLNLVNCQTFAQAKGARQVVHPALHPVLKPEYTVDNATIDAQNIYNAVTGLGTDNQALINIIANRTNAQRQIIARTYVEMFKKELLSDIKGDSFGQFRSVLKGLIYEPPVYLAHQLNKALTAFITDDHVVAEILCTRSRDELIPIMNSYEKLYNKTLKQELDECLSGDQRTFLKAIITEKIRDFVPANPNTANDQLLYIPNANDYCTVPQNVRLSNLLAKESFEQIRYLAQVHEQVKRKTIEEQLKKYCTDGILLEDYETVVRFAKDPAKYYAEELYKAMEGLGTNENKLKRIIISRSEIDLYDIKKKYQELYKVTLASSIEDETSGHFKQILLKLIERSDVTGHRYY